MRALRLRSIIPLVAVAAAFACGTLRVAENAAPGVDGGLGRDGGASDDDDDDTPTDGGKKKPKPKDAASPADGTSVSTKGPVEIIASGFTNPQELALTDDSVFFTLRFDPQSLVRKVAKDGKTENEVIAEYDAQVGYNVARDVTIVGNEVVWMTTNADGWIYAAPLNGGASRRIHFVDHGTHLTSRGETLYFSEEAFNAFGYAVDRVQLDGGNARLVKGNEVRVGGIAVDATGVYWTSGGPLAAGKAAVRTQALGAVDAASTRDLFLGTKTYEMGGIALSEDDVFWAEDERDRVMRVPKAGGAATLIAEVGSPRRVAVDDRFVWFTTSSTVSRVPLAGGEVEDFVTEIDQPIGLAVDAMHVYWAASGSGEIGRIHK